jgi:hypothetical protein
MVCIEKDFKTKIKEVSTMKTEKERELSRLKARIDAKKEVLGELKKQWDEAIAKVITNKAKGTQSYEDDKEQARLANAVSVARGSLRQMELEYNDGKGTISDDEVEAIASTMISGWKKHEGDDLSNAIAATY